MTNAFLFPEQGAASPLVRLLAQTAIAAQLCELAAQRADLQGRDLAAAALRSVGSGFAGQTHVLLDRVLPNEALDTAHDLAVAADTAELISEQYRRLANEIGSDADPETSEAFAEFAVLSQRMTTRIRSVREALPGKSAV